jgi:hypothetical protein
MRHMPVRRGVAVLLACVAGLLVGEPLTRAASDTLPSRLTDQEFWRLSQEFSEPNGYFQSDNLVSNEDTFQYVVPTIQKNVKPGGVYLGVAPDQNFTYLLAADPKMAFIVDIRRGNLHTQLMYKALLELSSDRADFVSRLFSKKRPAGLTATSTPLEIFRAFYDVKTDDDLYKANLQAIDDQLVKRHGIALSPDDLKGIEYVYWNFYWYGPAITYSSSSSQGYGRGQSQSTFPSYADLMIADDGLGRNQCYLANDTNFQAMKAFEEKNLLVPVVGDFAGPKALRAVGKWIREHGSVVSAFYTSNVEQYLFQNGVWAAFYTNVGTLPVDGQSTFIRSVSIRYGYTGTMLAADGRGSALDPIGPLVKDFEDGKIRSYLDINFRSK